jgi:hypothetical protein
VVMKKSSVKMTILIHVHHQNDHFNDNFLAWLSKSSSHWNEDATAATKWPCKHGTWRCLF